jgi:hypothetical protein
MLLAQPPIHDFDYPYTLLKLTKSPDHGLEHLIADSFPILDDSPPHIQDAMFRKALSSFSFN